MLGCLDVPRLRNFPDLPDWSGLRSPDETPIRRILRLLEQKQKLKQAALARAVCAEKAGDLP